MSIEKVLSEYELNGLPKLPPGFMGTHFIRTDDRIHKILTLESSWKEILTGWEDMDKKVRGFHEATWEFFTTERSYVLLLKLAVDVYLAVLLDLQQKGILNEVDIEILLENIKEIYRFHLELWENQLYPILKEFRKSKRQFAENHIIKMYKNIEKMQKPYLKYLQNASEAIDYGMHLQKTKPSFQKFCSWCERQQPIATSNSASFQHISLDSIQSNPHQRITRYGILLGSILKRCPDASDKLKTSFDNVDGLCRWLNNRVKMGELEKRIKYVSFSHFKVNSQEVSDELSRLENLKSCFDLKGTIVNCSNSTKRSLVYQADGVEFKTSEQKSQNVTIIILTDVVLICHSNDKSTKLMKELTLIRAPIRTDKINPIKSDNRIHLLVMSDYGCPENCFTLDFKQIIDTRDIFLEKLLEARQKFKAAQNGKAFENEIMRKLDKLHLMTRNESDPESPDECVFGSAGKSNQTIPSMADALDVNPDLTELGFGPSEVDIGQLTGNLQTAEPVAANKKSKSLFKLPKRIQRTKYKTSSSIH